MAMRDEKLIWGEAAQVIQEWRAVTVKSFHENKDHVTDRRDFAREIRNQLSQLGAIETEFRKRAGHDPKEIFRASLNRNNSEGIE